jgi:hypothetical protein
VFFVPAIPSPLSKLPMDAVLFFGRLHRVIFEKNISIKNYLEKYKFGIRPYTF